MYLYNHGNNPYTLETMGSTNERLRYLIQSYLTDTISADEWAELRDHVKSLADNEDLYTVIDGLWEDVALEQPMEIASDAIYRQIIGDPNLLADPPTMRQKPLVRTYRWPMMGSAAALLCIALTWFFADRYHQRKEPVSALAHEGTASGTILPGGNIATLTLADGTVIKLDEASVGNLKEVGESRIVKSADGLITYEATGSIAAMAEKGFNEINTPKGGEYRVILPDGTKVWLNAESSLRYPVSFVGGTREVDLVGEAYFEVSRDARHPSLFVVNAKNQRVEVLGTHFNVNAYADNAAVKTTLLEGSVKVTMTAPGRNVSPHRILKPNEQAATTDDGIQVAQVDAANAVAWKNGYFAFDNENISDVMNTIARWYDIEVTYEGDTAGKVFGGTISRFESFEKLLKTIGLTGTIQFKINGRRVTVMT